MTPAGKDDGKREGGTRELLGLAWPFILSNSLWTLQVALDRIFLSRAGGDAVGAAMVTAAVFWTPITLFQFMANYATTFVAQYTGAGQPHRVGPAVWQGLYVSIAGGLLFLVLVPMAGALMAQGRHEPPLLDMEVTYLRCLCFAALPILVSAAAGSFFSGRGDSTTVMWINASGLLVNAPLAYAWIFGLWGFPAWGIAGAGWATVVGSATSACLALILMLRPHYRAVYHTLSGWRPEANLMGRLLRYGFPNGLQVALDILAFTFFLFLLGWLGKVQLTASSIAFTLNMIAFLPAMGVAQAVTVLVGQRLGENRPAVAERSTWTGFRIAIAYMTAVAGLYVLAPGLLVWAFRSESDPEEWTEVAALVPVLLRFVAVYSLFDSMNLIFSFALRGAGDTRFVTVVTFVLSWPVMVLPTYAAWKYGWGLYWAWTFASTYVILLALTFFLRFRQGKWRSMRVIETPPVPEGEAIPQAALGLSHCPVTQDW
jgi:MATE family multidrug resistance protein